MIWAIVIVIIGFFVISAISNNYKDNESLAGTSVEEKFSIIINRIIEYGFDGNAIVKKGYEKNHLVILSPEGTNHLVELLYSYGNLQITWKYKFYQKEMIHKRTFLNIRNLSSFEQVKVADIIIHEIDEKILLHKVNVMGDLNRS